jgi:hypothetical protein
LRSGWKKIGCARQFISEGAYSKITSFTEMPLFHAFFKFQHDRPGFGMDSMVQSGMLNPLRNVFVKFHANLPAGQAGLREIIVFGVGLMFIVIFCRKKMILKEFNSKEFYSLYFYNVSQGEIIRW